MIYTDKNGMTIIEYGHGSIMGFATDNTGGVIDYGLVSTDKGEIDRPCELFESIVGQPLESLSPSVMFRFHKKESLKILINGLQAIYNRMD